MIRFVLRKIQNKKWLTTCLLLGLIFLVAAVSCQPMFKAGSLNKMLLDSFHDAGVENNQHPAVIGRIGAYKTEKHKTERLTTNTGMSYISKRRDLERCIHCGIILTHVPVKVSW